MSDPGPIPASLNFLLLQVRNPGDPMRDHEQLAFTRALEVDSDRCTTLDLLTESLSTTHLATADVVLLGGSGGCSAAGEGPWLDRALDALRELVASRQPTFASCWGFQAMARAMGGTVVNNLDTAEVGTHQLFVTTAGRKDPLFGSLGQSFLAQMGHEDCVSVLPENATLLAFSQRNTHQAYRINDAPIYCTQFHPELTREDLHLRVEAYPQYIERIAGMPAGEFITTLEETPGARSLLRRFVDTVFAG